MSGLFLCPGATTVKRHNPPAFKEPSLLGETDAETVKLSMARCAPWWRRLPARQGPPVLASEIREGFLREMTQELNLKV